MRINESQWIYSFFALVCFAVVCFAVMPILKKSYIEFKFRMLINTEMEIK